MKKSLFLVALVCLSAFAAFSQTPDFSGKWTLDTTRTKLEGPLRLIESQTLTVAQTPKDVTITTATKRQPPPADAQGGGMGGGGGQGGGGGMRPGGGGMGGGMRGGGGGMMDGTTVYTLDGKEVTKEIDTQMGKQPVGYKGEIKEGKLKLQTSRSFTTPNGDAMSFTTKETWTLSADGLTLTVKRSSESPRGTNESEMIYTKQ